MSKGNRTTPKRIRMGYALFINRSGQKGAAFWERQGFLFLTSLEASEYRLKHFKDVAKWQISAVRVSAEKANCRGADTEARLNPSAKGGTDAA